MIRFLRAIALFLALLALTPLAEAAASLSDQQFLAADTVMQARVQQSLLSTCSAIANEAPTGLTGTMPTALHIKRANLCALIMTPAQLQNWKVVIAGMVATDTNVIADATQGGTVALSAGNAATQALLVTDAHIGNAISAQFNTLLSQP